MQEPLVHIGLGKPLEIIWSDNGKARIIAGLNHALCKGDVFRDARRGDVINFDTYEEAKAYMAWLRLRAD